MFPKMGFGSNLLILTNSIVLSGKQYLFYMGQTTVLKLFDVFFSTFWKPNNCVPHGEFFIL